MNEPELTPKEDAAAEDYQERLKRLGELLPTTDPGEIRARNCEKKELERRLTEYEDRKRNRRRGMIRSGTPFSPVPHRF